MNITRHYSFALHGAQVFEGAFAPHGHSVIQAFLYRYSDGIFRACLEGYPMVRAADGFLSAAPEGTEPWHLSLGKLPASGARASLADLWESVRFQAVQHIQGLEVSQAYSPREPYFVDKPSDPEIELLVLDSVFWTRLWDEVSSGGRVPRNDRPVPMDWALESANALLAAGGPPSAQQQALAYVIAFNAISCQDGPRDPLALLVEDLHGFDVQLPRPVRNYLDELIKELQLDCRFAPVAFNRLDFYNCVKAGLNLDVVLA